MGIGELFLLAVGLSMDAFAVSVCKGLAMKRATLKAEATCGLWFGGFQALMPTIGFFLGALFADAIEAFDHWVAFALLAIIGYSLYDTVVVFHRISKNASPQMKCSLLTCANRSLNEVIVRTINTSITSVIPVVFMLIIGTDTLVDFAFAMFCGMVVGVYSTLAISAPIYTKWKAKEPAYARLENKYPYEVVQSPFTKQMMIEARKETAAKLKIEKEERAKLKQEEREAAAKIKQEEKEAQREAARGEHDIAKTTKRKADQAHEELKQAEKDAEAALDEEFAPDRLAVEAEEAEAAETPAEKATGADDEKQPATSTGVESQVDAAQDAPVEAVEEIDEEIVPAEAARPDEETEVEVGEEIAEQSEEPAEESERASGRYSAEKRFDQDDDVITTTSFSYGYAADADDADEGEDRRD